MRSIFFLGMLVFASAQARLSSSTFDDIKTMLHSGQESAAELTGYYFLRTYPKSEQRVDVKFMLAEIYERQTRLEEMVLWLKDLERDPGLSLTDKPRLSYMLYAAQTKRGDRSAAEIQKSLLLRLFPQSDWAKKVNAQ
ncbi:MAG TPA: hypothetical protein VM901_08295 [Bdellovibrionota bacterium]|jgi:hypothetical protein|nr:hypothetical protein [Bdellovibrionota bacterium]